VLDGVMPVANTVAYLGRWRATTFRRATASSSGSSVGWSASGSCCGPSCPGSQVPATGVAHRPLAERPSALFLTQAYGEQLYFNPVRRNRNNDGATLNNWSRPGL